jgi:hypothetical protein
MTMAGSKLSADTQQIGDSVYRGSHFGVSGDVIRCIGDQEFGVSGKRLSVYQGLSCHRSCWKHVLFWPYPHLVTRARDLNWDLTLLTPTQPTDSKGGSAPLASLTHPTRLTPIRNALRATSNQSHYRAARYAAGKISRNHGIIPR